MTQLFEVLLNPVNIALALLLMVLAYLVLWPFFQLVLRHLLGVKVTDVLSRDAVPGEFTWFHWLQATASPISEKMLYSPLLNTLITGVISTSSCTLSGRSFGMVCGEIKYARKRLGFNPFLRFHILFHLLQLH